jgi:hypothetical protein
MKINISPNLDQIRFFARSALHAFDFQSPENARATVIADMQALLEYLATLDEGVGVAVAAISKVKGGIALKSFDGDEEIFDLRDGQMDRVFTVHSSDGEGAVCRRVKDVRMNLESLPTETKGHHGLLGDCGADQ